MITYTHVVKVDDEVFERLLALKHGDADSANKVLRRLLGLPQRPAVGVVLEPRTGLTSLFRRSREVSARQ